MIEFKFSNGNRVKVVEFKTIDEVAQRLIEPLTTQTVALSGGSTYDKLFEAWAKVDFPINDSWYIAVDERAVDMTHESSNWGNACKKFFQPKKSEKQCKNHYKTKEKLLELLETKFKNSEVVFDTIFLGVGDDGHTASLFPNTPFVNDMNSLALETVSPKGIKERVTLGAKVIISAKEVITVLTGAGKEATVDWLFNEDMNKPFVSILSKREYSTLYLDSALFSKAKKLYEQK